jgi:hypothetical protein
MFHVPEHISAVTQRAERTPPDLSIECPSALGADLRDELRAALRARHADRLGVDAGGVSEVLDVDALTGPRAAIAVAVVGTARRAHEVFVFARGATGNAQNVLDGPLGVVVDYLDGILDELVGADDAFLPLDWEGRPFKHQRGPCVVFVRGEVRDYLAEDEAARLLQEDPAPRAIAGFPAR